MLFFPGAEASTCGGASHGGRLFREHVRGHLRFLAKHHGAREAERARRLLRASLLLRGAALPRRARPGVPRRGRLARRRRCAELLERRCAERCVQLALPARVLLRCRCSRYCRLLPADGAGPCCGCGSRPPACCCPATRSRVALCAALGDRALARGGSPRPVGHVRPRGSLGVALVLPASRRSRCRLALRGGPPAARRRWLVFGGGRRARRRALARRRRARRRRRSSTSRAARSCDAFDELSLDAVNEFADGGLHPGYAFPLWHGFLALVANVAGVDPAASSCHEASDARAGRAARRLRGRRTRSSARAAAGVAVVCAQVGADRARAGHGGAYTALGAAGDGQPPAARAGGARALLRLRPRRRPLAAAARRSRRPGSRSRSCTRPTRSSSACRSPATSSLRALVGARRAAGARDGAGGASCSRRPRSRLAAAGRAARRPRTRRRRASSSGRFAQYPGQLDVFSDTSYRLAPEVFGRGGAIAVAALVLVPLAALALLRRWAAFVLGGSLAVLAVMLASALFPPFADLVSLSQSRRAAGFLPFAFAFAGGAARAGRLAAAWLVLPVALAAGIVLQLALPGRLRLPAEGRRPGAGDLDRRRSAARRRRWSRRSCAAPGLRSSAPTRLAAAAAALFVAARRRRTRPATGSPSRRAPAEPAHAGAGARRCVTTSRKGDVVFSDIETSYRIAAYRAGLRRLGAAGARRRHGGESALRAPQRRAPLLRTGDLVIPRRYGADWLVVDRSRFDVAPELAVVYRDGRYTLYAPCYRRHAAGRRARLLLVTLYFPPAGGGGVQRPLKFAHVPAGARDRDARARARRPEVDPPRRRAPPPTQAWVHRARYVGPRGRRPAEELHGMEGARARARARRRSPRGALLVPDENVSWNLTAIPAAIRIVRAARGSTSSLTTSPPGSVHLVGAAVKKATGVRWVADLRDSLVAHPHRRAESAAVRVKEKGDQGLRAARRPLGGRDRRRLRRDRRRGARLRAARPRS